MQNLMIPATAVHQIKEEPRVLDTDLAEWLGYAAPRQVRELIDRNAQELRSYGNLSRHTTNSGKRGRPGQAYYLNEGQALVICALSRTDKAAQVRKALIDVFMDYRAGKIVPVKAHNRRPPSGKAEDLLIPYLFSITQQRVGDMAVLSLTMPLGDALDLIHGRNMRVILA